MRHVTAGRVVRRAPLPRLGLRFDGMQRRSLPLPRVGHQLQENDFSRWFYV